MSCHQPWVRVDMPMITAVMTCESRRRGRTKGEGCTRHFLHTPYATRLKVGGVYTPIGPSMRRGSIRSVNRIGHLSNHRGGQCAHAMVISITLVWRPTTLTHNMVQHSLALICGMLLAYALPCAMDV